MYKILIFHNNRDLGLQVAMPEYYMNFRFDVLEKNSHMITNSMSKTHSGIHIIGNTLQEEYDATLTEVTNSSSSFKYYLTFNSQDDYTAFVLRWS